MPSPSAVRWLAAYIQALPSAASGTISTADPTANVEPSAGNASVVGSANTPAISLAPSTVVALVVILANTPGPDVEPSSGIATTTGAANAPAGSVAGGPGSGSATAAAGGPSASLASAGGLASGTGAANQPGASVAPSIGLATASGHAYDAIVSDSETTNLAQVAVTADAPGAEVDVNAAAALTIAAAYNPSIVVAESIFAGGFVPVQQPFIHTITAGAQAASARIGAHSPAIRVNDDDLVLSLLL